MTLVALLVTAGAAAAIIETVRRVGRRTLLDQPNERSSHTRPTPRGGGVGVILPALVGWLLTDGRGGAAPVIGVAVACVAAVSWFDDRHGVPFALRLAFHVGAAALAVWATGPLREVMLPGLGTMQLGALAWPISLVWIVGLVNAYNFMDGIDGIAGIQGVVAAAAWAYVGWHSGVPEVGTLGALVGVGCLVFLSFNWSPAKIFLGDVGSAPLGFIFAALPLLEARGIPSAAPAIMVVGVAVVWPFVFDASLTFLRRLGRGENVFAAHRSHLYQRAVIAGWSHAAVALLYGGLALASAAAGLEVARRGEWSLVPAAAATLVAVFLLLFVARLERR